jgi:hypothetical protein
MRLSENVPNLTPRVLVVGALQALALGPTRVRAAGDVVDEIHYTFTGATSVTFDWRGAATDIRYGKTTATSVTLSTAWQPVTVTYAPVSPGSSTLDFNAYVSKALPGTCFYADDASIYLSG